MNVFNILGRIAAPILLAATVGFPAYAQVDSSTTAPRPVQLASNIETVIVTGLRLAGPGVSDSGANDYSFNSADIAALPAGDNTSITDVLTQMPGVAIDQNAQIHIRNTEGPQFQYQIDGALIPLDINTNPPFISMINPMFVSRLDLLDGILPSRYSYATGGVVDIETKDGCQQPGGSATIFFGQRGTFEPSAEYAGCDGKISYYTSALYDQNEMAFSSATPGPNAIHDQAYQGQTLDMLSYAINDDTKVSLLVSAAASNNQLPNVPGLQPEFTLAGAPVIPSSRINSTLDFRDYLAVLSLSSVPTEQLSYQISYAAHSISERFDPDDVGELIYQGVASHASHNDLDNTLQGDLTYKLGAHTIGAGFYLGAYDVTADDNSLVFPGSTSGQTSDVPYNVINNSYATNILTGLYLNDLWQIDSTLRADIGLRWDTLSGFTRANQLDPTINLAYMPQPDTTFHIGAARYMQVPSFLGISPGAPDVFKNSTAEEPSGIVTPVTEDDVEFDLGAFHTLAPGLTISEDNFYEITKHYLDTGQFGVVPIFAPFNYDNGYIWGSELAIAYKSDNFSTYGNVTVGRNMQKGVVTGQFNFDDPGELAYINANQIVLDHQPLLGITAGGTYDWDSWSFSADATYSSGLRAGFADTEQLPNVFQVNVGIERKFEVPGVGEVSDRLTILNAFDRTNLIRPSEGIGIFQSAYGPRFTVFDAITVPL